MSESREVEIRQWHGMLEEELRQVIQPSRGERRVADYVAWLLTELERVRAERDAARADAARFEEALAAMSRHAAAQAFEADKLRGEVSRLQEALREMTARYGRPATESGGPFL